MSRLLLLLLVIPVFSQDLFGTFYSFDVDFYRTFNSKCCDSKNSWYLVDYSSLRILTPESNSLYGIRASVNSCTSSFPFLLVPNSTLELVLYVSTVAKTSGLTLSVLKEEDNTPLSIYSYTSNDLVNGWSSIKIDIKTYGFGYVNIQGHSQPDEFILIDSISYVPNNQNKNLRNYDDEDEIIFSVPEIYAKTVKIHDDSNEMFNENDDLINYDDLREGSAEGSGDDDDFEAVPVATRTLGLWAIVIIVVGSVTVLALVGVACYHLGKNKSRDDDFFGTDIEPDTVVSIPRAKPMRALNIRKYL